MAPLTVLGQFTANLTFKHITCKQTVCVIKDLKNNLLGLPAIASLNLISRINSVYCSTDEVMKLFPHLFQGLGSLGEEYEIKLKEDAKPFLFIQPEMYHYHYAGKYKMNGPYSLLVRASYFISCSVHLRFTSVLPIDCKWRWGCRYF